MSESMPKLKVGGFFQRNSDLFLAAGMMGILFVLIVPLPPVILDLAITLNLAMALMVLIITLTVKTPVEFNTFPSLLLFTTLFRLSLNVASTRLILLNGGGGEIIEAFGDFVVGGNLLIGLVIFLILVIIQFVVITKGSSRISEVAARFTLDAMPGKQMAIDADLNAGLIDETQAQERRLAITSEAEFYGSMDGAGKFVRGDSVAGLIITIVNIVGGMVVGMLDDMAVSDALAKYAVLTVGDGLVTQVPALVISVASGVLVTKARSETPLSEELASQFFLSPKNLKLSAMMVAAFGAVPGLPTVPFFTIAGVMILGSRVGTKALADAEKAEDEPEEVIEPETASELTPEALQDLLKVDRMGVEIGYRLISLVDQDRSGNLLDHIAMVRKQFAQQYGLVVPPIRMRDNLSMEPNEYRILISGQELARGQLYPEHVLAMNPGQVDEDIRGISTVDPTFGLPATWVPNASRSEAEILGYTVVDPESVLVTHLTEVVKGHAHEILSREDVQVTLERLKETAPTVVNELVPDLLSVGTVQKVLANLLRERIPIRNLISILEALADHAREDKNPDSLTERVRTKLSRTLSELHAGPNGRIAALTLSPMLEQEAMQVLVGSSDPNPSNGALLLQRLQAAVLQSWQEAQIGGSDAVLLVRGPLRRHLADLFRTLSPPIPVLSFGEVLQSGGVDSAGVVELAAPPPPQATAAAAG